MFPRKVSNNMFGLKDLMELMNKADSLDFQQIHDHLMNREVNFCSGSFYIGSEKFAIRYDRIDRKLLVFKSPSGEIVFNETVNILMVLVLIRTIRLRRITMLEQESFTICGHSVMFDDTLDMIKLYDIMGDFPINVCLGHGKKVKEIVTINHEVVEKIKSARERSGR